MITSRAKIFACGVVAAAAVASVVTPLGVEAAGAATPSYGGSVAASGLCPSTYLSDRLNPRYATIEIRGHLTGYTAGQTYAVVHTQASNDGTPFGIVVADVTADAAGGLNLSLKDTSGGIPAWGNSVSVLNQQSAPGTVYPVGASDLPNLVSTSKVAIGYNPACNPWTMPTGTTFAIGHTDQFVSLKSANGAYFMYLRSLGSSNSTLKAGDLVIQGPKGPIWKVRKPGASRLVLQKDGNLVLYSKANKALWQTKTYGHPADELVMQKDGNLVIYSASPQHKVLWQAKTYEH